MPGVGRQAAFEDSGQHAPSPFGHQVVHPQVLVITGRHPEVRGPESSPWREPLLLEC